MTRILLVKTSSLGDVVHNLPVIRDIRRSVPDVEIDWVVEEGFADIPAMHVGVNEVHGVALRRWRHSLFSSSTRNEISELKRRLQSRTYDTVIDTQGLLKSAWVAHWAPGASVTDSIDQRFENPWRRYFITNATISLVGNMQLREIVNWLPRHWNMSNQQIHQYMASSRQHRLMISRYQRPM